MITMQELIETGKIHGSQYDRRKPAWQPLETAPKGYDGQKFNHVLFRGVSKARSFSGTVYVSGWMDNDRQPVHEYAYKLIITGWMPLGVIEGTNS